MREIILQNDRIIISFPYSAGIIAQIKETLADYSYDPKTKTWSVPATRFHAQLVRAFAKDCAFTISGEVLSLALSTGQHTRTRLTEFDDKLYKFQKSAVKFLIDANGRALVADEQGLGKTIEVLSYLYHADLQPVLVVAPATVIYNWKREIERWTGWSAQVLSKGKTPIDPNCRIQICSYDIMTSKLRDLKDHGYQAVIFDECHHLANDSALRTKAARLLADAPHLIGLSGTPFLNRPIEMFTILNMINPVLWPSKWKYAMRYCDAHQTGFGWDLNGHSNETELHDRLLSTMIRRTKEEVKDQLPDLQRTVIEFEADLKTYRKIIKDKKLDKDSKMWSLRQAMGLIKVKPTLDLARDILNDPNQKLVIYAHHKAVVSELEADLSKDYSVSTITGSVSKEDRAERIQNFQDTPNPRVMIISEAGGEGINLYRASSIIFTEYPWNPGKLQQAEARLHRIGQTEMVTSYHLVIKDTIDEDIYKIITEKEKLFKQIILLDDTETTVLQEILKLL